MAYAKGALAGIAAIFATLLLPGLIHAFSGISREKATGLAAVAGGLSEAFLSPLFWIGAFFVFALFLATSRLDSKALRVLFFWAPALMKCDSWVRGRWTVCLPAFQEVTAKLPNYKPSHFSSLPKNSSVAP